MHKLTLGYSTMAHRVGNITPPPLHANWQLVVVVQNPEGISWRGQGLAGLMLRDDLSVEELSSVGVAKSRNRAIWLANSEYLVFSDDDIKFDVEGLEAAIDYLDQHPQYSLLLAQAADPEGKLRKRYPKKEVALTRLNSARAATYEMVIRVDAVRQLGVWFDEDFGAGAKNYLGDEYIFIVDLIKAGGKAVFAPITIATHPHESSGSRWGSEVDRVARAKVFTRVFGKLAPLIRAAFAIRRLKELGSLRSAWLFVLGR
jgi:GT2 family glycosyltransferase